MQSFTPRKFECDRFLLQTENHHQCYPMALKHEENFSADLPPLDQNTSLIIGRGSIVMGITRVQNSNLLVAVSDKIKGRGVDGH